MLFPPIATLPPAANLTSALPNNSSPATFFHLLSPSTNIYFSDAISGLSTKVASALIDTKSALTSKTLT